MFLSSLDYQVSGACSSGNGIIANTTLAMCLPGESCPTGFRQIDAERQCNPSGRTASKAVCCLVDLSVDVNVSSVY